MGLETTLEFLPDWNKPGAFSAGRDPLGLQAASVRLYTELLPGLTNVTNRLRYFSFYCWVVRQFELRHFSDDEQKWSIFIRRAEAVYVLACIRGDNDKALGMAGSTWANDNSKLDNDFDFTPWTDKPGENNQYLKAGWGNFGQFYVASMQQMKMLRSTRQRVQMVSEGFGMSLANAFEEACPKACQFLLAAIEDGTISPAECDEISDEAHPAYINASSREGEQLVRYLCGDRSEDPTSRARRESLWNILNIVDRTGAADPTELRRELYIQNNIGTITDVGLGMNLIGWRAYFVNELCHISLELILNAMTFEINASGTVKSDIIARKLAERGLKTSDARTLDLRKYAEKNLFADLAEEHEAGLAIEKIVGSAENASDRQIVTSLNLLLSLWVRWGYDEALINKLSDATVEGRSAFGVFRLLHSFKDDLAIDAIAALIRKYVIANHLLIAGQKLAGNGTFTYRFIVDETELVDGIPAEYGFTNPRIGNLLTFAQDANLIEAKKLTTAGRLFLNAL